MRKGETFWKQPLDKLPLRCYLLSSSILLAALASIKNLLFIWFSILPIKTIAYHMGVLFAFIIDGSRTPAVFKMELCDKNQ